MSTHIPAEALERLLEVTEELRREGWLVETEPNPSSLPEPLRDRQIDFIAWRDKEILIGEVASRSSARKAKVDVLARLVSRIPNARLEVYWLGDTAEDDPRAKDILAYALEAHDAAHKVSPQAGLLIAWSALEGAITHYAAVESESRRQRSPREQLSNLYSLGYISEDDFDRLGKLFRLRSEIAHRASRVRVTVQDVDFVIALAERMATGRYASVDEMVEWYASAHKLETQPSYRIEKILLDQFPDSPQRDLRKAIRVLKLTQQDS